MIRILLLAAIICTFISSVSAAGIKYYPDPVYKKLAAADHHPMDELANLAEDGDVRAQFIMADLYSKGKGGLPLDIIAAKKWFEKAAIHGYYHSFIRLAALSKKEKKYLKAWEWYTLAIRLLETGEKRKFVISARAEMVNDNKLSSIDIEKVRKNVTKWETMRDITLSKETKAEYEKRKKEKAAKKKDKLFAQKIDNELMVDVGIDSI